VVTPTMTTSNVAGRPPSPVPFGLRPDSALALAARLGRSPNYCSFAALRAIIPIRSATRLTKDLIRGSAAHHTPFMPLAKRLFSCSQHFQVLNHLFGITRSVGLEINLGDFSLGINQERIALGKFDYAQI
jgi:hypothetical protein